jgi:hypothetical protein
MNDEWEKCKGVIMQAADKVLRKVILEDLVL